MRGGTGRAILRRMLTRRLLPTIVVGLGLLAIAAVAGAGESRTARQLDAVKRATARFKDVSKAEAAGYVATSECVTGRGGAMGVHYLNAALVGDPKLDLRKPELLLYEPQEGGGMKLVGVEWMVLEKGQARARAFWAGASTGPWTTTAPPPCTTTCSRDGAEEPARRLLAVQPPRKLRGRRGLVPMFARGAARRSARPHESRTVREHLRRAARAGPLEHHRGDLEVAGEAFEREVARLEHAGQPADLALEAAKAVRLGHRPVHEVLVVVHAPRDACIAVPVPLVRELGAVAGADLLGQCAEVERFGAVGLRGRGRRGPTRRLGHSATTS